MNSILQYKDLIEIPVRETNEPLVIVQKTAINIICRYEKKDMLPYLGNDFLLRKGAIKRLKSASHNLQLLRPDAKLRLVYAYRHPDVQSSYFEMRKKEVAVQYPDLSDEELISRTHLLTASPDVAGHPTGGAIDVTIQDANEQLDMGSAIANFASDKIETFAAGLTDVQRDNRALLRHVLLSVGFAPFNGEWWHFSYGDREWAAYYGKANAIYNQIKFEYKK